MSAAVKQVLVGGGSGFVGRHLCNGLKNKGYGVTIVSRMPGPQRISWEDLAATGLPENTSVVVSLAGQNVLDPTRRWTPGFKQNVWASRVNTTSALAHACLNSDTRPEVFVSISGVGVYNPSPTEEYSEESSVKEFDFLSGLCLAWECAANRATTASIRTVIIRSGIARLRSFISLQIAPEFLNILYRVASPLPDHCEQITSSVAHKILHGVAQRSPYIASPFRLIKFSPKPLRKRLTRTLMSMGAAGVVLGKDGGMMKQLWLPFFVGLGGPIGSGSQYLPWIHIDDLVSLIIFAIENDSVRGVLNGVAPHVITNKEFSLALARAMSRPALFQIPAFVLNLAFSEERAKMMTEGQKVIPKKTLETGFQFQYSNIDDAVHQIVGKPK